MTNRVTKEMLQRRLDLLNDMTGAPREPYRHERDSRGGLVANDGCYHLDIAYGGFRVARMCVSGGCRDISPRLSKPALADWINAYIDGVEVGLKLHASETA